MDINTAKEIIYSQRRNFKKIRNIRFSHCGYEFRVDYRGGFGEYIAIDFREIGKRNFKYFGGFGACHCSSNYSVMSVVCSIINDRFPESKSKITVDTFKNCSFIG